MAEIIDSFKNRLYSALQIRKMKQVELSEKTGISRSSINQYLSGYASNIPTEKIQKLAIALDVSPVWLIGYDVPMDSTTAYGIYSKESANLMMDVIEGDSKTSMELIQIIKEMDEEQRESLRQYALFLLSQKHKDVQ